MIEVTKSSATGKKYTATMPSGKKVHFGAKGYQDFTQHGDEARRKNYLARHGGGGQNWGDRETAGYWSRWLLWEKPTLAGAAAALRKKGVAVKLRV